MIDQNLSLSITTANTYKWTNNPTKRQTLTRRVRNAGPDCMWSMRATLSICHRYTEM